MSEDSSPLSYTIVSPRASAASFCFWALDMKKEDELTHNITISVVCWQEVGNSHFRIQQWYAQRLRTLTFSDVPCSCARYTLAPIPPAKEAILRLRQPPPTVRMPCYLGRQRGSAIHRRTAMNTAKMMDFPTMRHARSAKKACTHQRDSRPAYSIFNTYTVRH